VKSLNAGLEGETPGHFANVRANNPGAMYPGAAANKFGTTGTSIIGGGHQIANFPSPVHGAAANMENLRQNYAGMTIGAAMKKWSGDSRGTVPGFDSRTRITPQMLNDPKFMVPFHKSITSGEAPGKYPMDEAQWQQAFKWYQHGGVPKGEQAAGRTGSSAGGPPSSVLERARSVAVQGPGAVQAFMARQGYPMSGRWCGEYAASVIRSMGGTPPGNPAVASNWRNYGAQTSTPVPGDIAVRKGGRTGATGSHVTFFEGYNRDGTFRAFGGNQGRWSSNFRSNQFTFHHDPTVLDKQIAAETTHKVEGSGHLDVNVNAPRGTNVRAKTSGMFKSHRINRISQMQPASAGPPEFAGGGEE
jgi:hypothetical protein